ncbi:MAG: serine protease [Rhizobiaceae bacterium]|jgi:hypothetical protein
MNRSGSGSANFIGNLDGLYNLCWAFKAAIGAIDVWNEGGRAIGTGFHVGKGYVITAAHVLEGASRATLSFHHFIARQLPAMGSPSENRHPYLRHMELQDSPEEIDLPTVIYHDRSSDIALFRSSVFAANDIERYRTQMRPIPSHLYDRVHLGTPMEDVLGDDLLMLQGVVLGYPSIPFSTRPVLVAHEFRISAVIDRYDTGRPAFVLSGMPRGGFGGAPVIASGGWFLGVITEALYGQTLADPQAAPYFQMITLDPVLEILQQAGTRPDQVNPELAALYREFDIRK